VESGAAPLGVPATELSVEDARPARVRSRSARHFQVEHGHPLTLAGPTRVPFSPRRNDQDWMNASRSLLPRSA
jgi:hypothetical protein